MTRPNFFVLGASQAVTTVLYHAMRAHDDVFLPEGELTLDAALRAELTDRFTEVFDRLEPLLGRELSAWRM